MSSSMPPRLFLTPTASAVLNERVLQVQEGSPWCPGVQWAGQQEDKISWNAMILSFTQNGCSEDVVRLF
jgi:hypothetical protein